MLLKWIQAGEFTEKSASVNVGEWQKGKILKVDDERCTVYLYDQQQEVKVDNGKVLPYLPKSIIAMLLKNQGIQFDLNQAIKKHSLSNEKGASRIRFEKTQAIIESLAETIFPLSFSGTSARLKTIPAPLLRRRADTQSLLALKTIFTITC